MADHPVFGPTVSHPLTDDFSLRANRSRERAQPSGVPSFYPLHKRNDPQWSGNNEIGIEQSFAPDANNRQVILKLEEWDFPEVWTLCLGIVYDAAAYANQPNSGPFTVVAQCDFGSGGAVQVVEVDWKQGVNISLPLNALSVIATYSVLENEGGTIVPPSDLRLRATLVRGPLPGAMPTRSFLLLADAAGEAACPVPPFAKALRLMPAAPFGIATPFDFYSTTDAVTLSPFEVSGQTVAAFHRSQFVEYIDFTNSVCGRPVAVPIADGSRFLNLSNVPGFGVIAEFLIGI